MTTFPMAALRHYLGETGWLGEQRAPQGHVFYRPQAVALDNDPHEIMLPASDDEPDAEDGSRPTATQYQRDALAILAKVEGRPVDQLISDIWPEQSRSMSQGGVFGPANSLVWERESGVYATADHLLYEVVKHRESDTVVGWIEKFYAGAPTYAWARRQRLGGFITIAAAVHAVEKALADFEPGQVLS